MERLICKHYHTSYIELRDGLDLYEYYVLSAGALRGEEREQYNLARLVNAGVNNPKAIKNWKWRYDKGGNATRIEADTPMHTIAAFAASKAGNLKATGSGYEFAKATGRPYGFLTSDGLLFNEEGEPIAQVPGMVIIKVSETPQ